MRAARCHSGGGGGLMSEDGKEYGQIQFATLLAKGVLGSDLKEGSGGFTRYWDDCSGTPFLSNGNTLVSYDDTKSISLKAEWAKKNGILGVGFWDIHGDKDYALIKAAREGLGVPESNAQ